MKKTLLTFFVFFAFAASAALVNAQTQTITPTNGVNSNTFCTGGTCTYVPLEPLPGLPNTYGPQNSFASLIPSAFKLLIGAGAVIAVIMLVLGALTYMFSDIVGNKKKALDRIRGAMWAIVLLVSSYLILVTINPDLVKFTLNLNTTSNFTPASGTTGTTPAASTPAQIPSNTIYSSAGPVTLPSGTAVPLSGFTNLCETSFKGKVQIGADGSYFCVNN